MMSPENYTIFSSHTCFYIDIYMYISIFTFFLPPPPPNLSSWRAVTEIEMTLFLILSLFQYISCGLNENLKFSYEKWLCH